MQLDDTSKKNADLYLCFSHPDYGIAQIPTSVWEMVQKYEGWTWKVSKASHDRGDEHLEGFGKNT